MAKGGHALWQLFSNSWSFLNTSASGDQVFKRRSLWGHSYVSHNYHGVIGEDPHQLSTPRHWIPQFSDLWGIRFISFQISKPLAFCHNSRKWAKTMPVAGIRNVNVWYMRMGPKGTEWPGHAALWIPVIMGWGSDSGRPGRALRAAIPWVRLSKGRQLNYKKDFAIFFCLPIIKTSIIIANFINQHI